MAKSAVDKALSKFQVGLELYRDKLKRRARGRICGTCRFYLSGGLCVEQDIEVHYEDAVACERHEDRKDV